MLLLFKSVLDRERKRKSSSLSHDFFQKLIKSPSWDGRYVDADIPMASWFSRQADGNKEPSPLTLWKKRGRRWFMGVAFPLVQSLHGKVLHECIQGIVSLPFPGALFRLTLLLAPLSSRLSISSAPLFFFVSASSSSLFLPCSREYRGMHRHFRASPRYRCCKSTRHRWDLWATVRILSLAKAQWTLRTVTIYHAKFLKIVDKHQCTNTACRYIKIKFGRDRCLVIITSFGRVRWTSETVRNVPKFFSQKSWSLSVSTSVYYCTIIKTYF